MSTYALLLGLFTILDGDEDPSHELLSQLLILQNDWNHYVDSRLPVATLECHGPQNSAISRLCRQHIPARTKWVDRTWATLKAPPKLQLPGYGTHCNDVIGVVGALGLVVCG